MIRRLRSSGSTRLLVSVASPTEAGAALAGGADVVDAKDPTAGALGRVDVDVLAEIHSTTCGRATVTAALGDVSDVHRTERLAAQYSSRGAGFVKLGFAGITDGRRVDALLAAAVRGCARGGRATGVVAHRIREALVAQEVQGVVALVEVVDAEEHDLVANLRVRLPQQRCLPLAGHAPGGEEVHDRGSAAGQLHGHGLVPHVGQ